MSLATLPAIAARVVPVATAAQMAEADRIASAELGIPLEVLMENAAHRVAAATRLFLDRVDGLHVVAVAGTGNNGGDALAALRHLRSWGARVEAYVAGPRERLRPLAALQYDILRSIGVPLHDTTAMDDRRILDHLMAADAVLDGLLGYGTTSAPRGEVARLIALTSAGGGDGARPVVAVDLPSGLDPDTGSPLGPAPAGTIVAALTVTLALPKTGLLLEPARPFVGELVLADIGIPAEAYDRMGIAAQRVFAGGDLVRIIH